MARDDINITNIRRLIEAIRADASRYDHGRRFRWGRPTNVVGHAVAMAIGRSNLFWYNLFRETDADEWGRDPYAIIAAEWMGFSHEAGISGLTARWPFRTYERVRAEEMINVLELLIADGRIDWRAANPERKDNTLTP